MRVLAAILLLLLALLPAQAQQGLSRALVVSSCGAPTLTVGGQVQATMDTTGRLCSHKTGGGGGCSQATAYLARATGETTHAADLTNLICGLVTDGVWASLDALYVLAQQTETDAKLNLIGTNYPLTQVGALGVFRPTPQTGTIVFTQYRGFAGFTTANAYFDTNFAPASAPTPHYTQNSANFGIWTNGAVSENTAAIGNGATGAIGESHIYDNYTGGLFYARVNNNSVGSVLSPGTAGLYVGDRPSSSTVVPYYNGVAQASQSSTSQSLAINDFRIGLVAVAASAQQFAEAHIGASLGALNTNLYNRLNTYMTAVGNVSGPTSVWSASDAAATGEILSNGGLTASPNSAGGWGTLRGTISKTAGKLYIEFSVAAPISAGDALLGLASSGFVPTNYLSSTTYSAFAYHSASLGAAGSAGFTVNYASTLPDYAAGDVWALAVDFTAGRVWVARNNVWSNSSNPATNSLPILSFVPATVGGLFPAISFFDLGSGTWTIRPTTVSQTYTPPVGFSPWN